jgi:hypothetical protein
MFKLCSLGIMVLLLISNQAYADEYKLNVGFFYANSDSNILVSSPKGGTFLLDFEDDLFLAKKQFSPYFEFAYRFNERHNLYIDWKQLHRAAETPSLEKAFQIHLDDVDYSVKAGGKLQTTLDFDIMRLGYGYDIWQGTDYSIGASVGLHTMFVKTAFEGTIGICVPDNSSAELCDSAITSANVIDESFTAPLPNIGFYANYEFYPKWQLMFHSQYFAIEYKDVKGSLLDIKVGVEAKIADSWSLSLAYNYYDIDVNIKNSRSITEQQFAIADHEINYSFTGPVFAVSYRF